MARARNIKPGFFKNEYLAELPPLTRLLFIALWCEADREGRLEDRPLRIKAEYFPYDDCDINTMLAQCEHSAGNFLTRYEVDGKRYIQIRNFKKHQNPHIKEQPSAIPPPPENFDNTPKSLRNSDYDIFAQCKHRICMVLAGLIPDSPFPFPLSKEESLLAQSSDEESLSLILEPEEPPPEDPVFLTLTLNDKTEFPVTEGMIAEFEDLYPSVDIRQQLRNMKGWCRSNDKKRKTRNGICKFINSWLADKQNNGGGRSDPAGRSTTTTRKTESPPAFSPTHRTEKGSFAGDFEDKSRNW